MGKNSGIAWTDHTYPRVNPLSGRSGPTPSKPRDGDKKQARRKINLEVRTGRISHPNMIPCKDCGHVWSVGERRHEYDHYLGYSEKHHLDVESVCTVCHSRRDCKKTKQTHCINGHVFSIANTYTKPNGSRMCKACAKERDKKRKRPDGYWKKINDKRRGKNGN